MNKPNTDKIIDFNKIFENYMASESKQKVWMYDRNKSMGASEAFDCLRKAFFKKKGFEQDKDFSQSWGAMERGNLIEDHFIVPALDIGLPEGVELIGAGQADQTTFLDEENKLSATPDSLIANLEKNALTLYGIDDIGSDCIIVEFKSIDPRVNLTEEKSIHRGQVNIQMGLIREQTEFKPNYAVILYVDASFVDNITPFIVKYDEKVFNTAKVRAKRMFAANEPNDLPAEGKVTGACKFCAWASQCNTLNLAAVPKDSYDKTISGKDRNVMAELVEKEQEAKERQKQAEMDVEQIRLDMKEFLKKLNSKNLKAEDGSWGVTYSVQKGRTSLDKEAMIEDGIDLTKYEKIGASFETLKVTTKKI